MAHSFATVKETTLCPYAVGARLAYGPKWDENVSSSSNWKRSAHAMARWSLHAEAECSHGFVLEVGSQCATDFEAVKALLRISLEELNGLDPAKSSCMNGGFEDLDWQFEFGRVRLFVNVFAPCYPPGHGKHTDNPRLIHLFFQPEYSFDLCGINPQNRAAKERIRRRFQKAGAPYDGQLIDKRQEAYLYLFPLNHGDPPVKWWE